MQHPSGEWFWRIPHPALVWRLIAGGTPCDINRRRNLYIAEKYI